MSAVDWGKAPEGATHWNVYNRMFYMCDKGIVYAYDSDRNWFRSDFDVTGLHAGHFVPRPTTPKPYTRDEALQFLVERLDTWPTDIADAPLCPGWGWIHEGRQPEFEESDPENSEFQAFIGIDSWQAARPDFQPFTSVEDTQPVATGQKFDSGKPIIGAIPPHAELAVARVMTFGAQKYARDNWRKIDDIPTRYMDAALRHLNAVRRGETVDLESGEHHLAHAACCILFMLDIEESR